MIEVGPLQSSEINPVNPTKSSNDGYINRAVNQLLIVASQVVDDELDSLPHELFVVG